MPFRKGRSAPTEINDLSQFAEILSTYWSSYRIMWLLVMFDLPVKTKVQRRRYSQFVRQLKKMGLWRVQFSVYVRPMPDDERLKVLQTSVQMVLPEDGEVRMLAMTERQWQQMKVFFGQKRVGPEKTPEQLELF